MTLFRQRPWSSGVILLVGILPIICVICVYVWFFTQSPRNIWNTERLISAVTFSSTGQLLASAEEIPSDPEHPVIVLRRVPDGRTVATLSGHLLDIDALAFSPDGRLLASAGADQTVRLWRVSTHQFVTALSSPKPSGSINQVVWSSDGQTVGGFTQDGYASWWRVSDGALLTSLQVGPKYDYGTIVFNTKRQLVAYASDNQIVIWRMQDAQIVTTINDFSYTPYLAFSPDGKLLAGIGSTNLQNIRLWNVDDGRVQANLTIQDGAGSTMLFSPDGQILAATSFIKRSILQPNEVTIQFWSLSDGARLTTFVAHSAAIEKNGLAFSPDGRYLASGSQDYRIGLWKVADIVGKQ